MKRFLTLYVIIFFWGCYSSSYQQKASIHTINQRILEDKVLNFITYEEKEYQFIIQRMDSLYLEGFGKMRRNSNSPWKDFKGSVPIDSINVLCFSEKDGGKSLLINSAVLTLLIKGLQAAEGPKNPTVELVYPSSGSSCPFIYSWQGTQYVLEGEAFGIAFGKAREMTTCTILPELSSKGQNLKVRITNERPETHFFNTISLHAVEIDEDARSIADNDQHLWPVYQITKPLSAFDNSEKNILPKLLDQDNQYWESDLDNHVLNSEFEDVIELSFHHPHNSKTGSLTIHAINTYFANLAYEKLFEFLGDQALSFLQASENDQEIIQGFNEWIIEGSLKVSVWNGTSWDKCGLIYPEANVAPFSRLVRLNIPDDIGNKVKIRLHSVADIWKIDAVGIDWTEVKKLDKIKVPLLSVEGQLSEDQIALIEKNDERYAILLPSQKIDLTYNKLYTPEGKKLSYALDVGGYLYEWLPQMNSTSLFASYGDMIGTKKIEFAKFLLKNKSLLLPPLYAEWQREKHNMSQWESPGE